MGHKRIYFLIIASLMVILGSSHKPHSAASLPDLSIEPIIRTHTERITSTNHTYTIDLGDTDITNHSIEIKGPVVNPKILNDSTPDFYDLQALRTEIMKYARDNSETERAKAVWRFMYDHFGQGAGESGKNYWSDAVDFFNSVAFGMCGTTGAVGPQLADAVGLQGRADKFPSEYMYSILADGNWITFTSLEGNGNTYWPGRDNQTLVSIEDIFQDLWLNRRMSMVRNDGELNTIGMEKMEAWWGYYGNDWYRNLPPDTFEMTYSLTKDESLLLNWIQAIDYMERFTSVSGNYPYLKLRAADGLHTYSPELQDPTFLEKMESYKNLQISPGSNPILRAKTAGTTSELVFEVYAPYMIMTGKIGGTFYRRTSNDANRIYASWDEGRSWELLWENDQIGEREHHIEIDIPDSYFPCNGCIAKKRHHSYLLKYEFLAQTSPTDAGLNEINVFTTLQTNQQALPALHRGRNQIMFTADLIGPEGIDVTFTWEEPRFQLASEDVFSIEEIDVELAVKNEGTAAATNVTIRLYPETAQWQTFATLTLDHIGPGEEKVIHWKGSYNTPYLDNFEVGRLVLAAELDPQNTIPELNEDNNRAVRYLRIFQGKDLSTIPEFISYYDDVGEVRAVFFNLGDISVENVTVQLYEGSEFSGPRTLLTQQSFPYIHLRDMAFIKAKVSQKPEGIWISIDSENTINEIDETNNLIFSRGTQAPYVDLGSVRTIGLGQSLTMTAQATDPDGTNIISYKWEIGVDQYIHHSPGDPVIKTGQTVTHTFTEEGKYMIRVYAVDENDEEGYDSTLVVVEADQSFAPEDLDLDSDVDEKDMELCIGVITGKIFDLDVTARADVNKDGSIDAKDVQQIVNRSISG